jgi:hypothetical protein
VNFIPRETAIPIKQYNSRIITLYVPATFHAAKENIYKNGFSE